MRWSRGTGLLPVPQPAIELLKADQTVTPQWAEALALIPDAQPYPQSADWRLADKILADGFLAYFRGFPNTSLPGVLDEMDTVIQDLIKK